VITAKIGVTLQLTMNRTSFDIITEGIDRELLRAGELYIEISDSLVTAVWLSKQLQQVYRLAQYPLSIAEGSTAEEALQDIFSSDDYFEEQVRETVIVYNYPDAQLVPAQQWDLSTNKPLLDLMTGDLRKGLVLSEKIKGQEVYTLYRVPRGVHDLLQRKFAAGNYWHFYSVFLNALSPVAEAGNMFHLCFYPDTLVLAVKAGEQLLLTQQFGFDQPEDVSWFLLNAATQLELSKDDLYLRVSGLIEPDSATFLDMSKYFSHISLDTETGWNNPGTAFNEYPAHYFSTLLKMALCV
jgi:Protein of unknown function (DUF3822)